jgi:hypothetical protein
MTRFADIGLPQHGTLCLLLFQLFLLAEQEKLKQPLIEIPLCRRPSG